MDNKELLMQIAELMEKQSAELTAQIQQSETRIKVLIENQVTDRINSLFDGYKLTHEKQWELEKQTQRMEGQLQELQARLTALENKIA